MGRAEIGTPKYIANKMKSKGLQRLRWYCQVCEKQCRDENGFKCHTQSESHVRQMLHNGENSTRTIEEYSKEFENSFLDLLKSSHQEKVVNVNRFYQEYISNKNHIHMNATKWTTLSQFAKYLGDKGVCRIEESDQQGLCISWIDNSPRALEMKMLLKRENNLQFDENEIQTQILQKQIKIANVHKQKESITTNATTGRKYEGLPVKIQLKTKNQIGNIPTKAKGNIFSNKIVKPIKKPSEKIKGPFQR